MIKLISFALMSLAIISCASQSQRQPSSELQSGDRAIIKPDWERIERGVTTGDFSCKGTCAEVSVDWNKVWRTVSGQEYRDRKQQNLSYCISQYQIQKSNLQSIQNRAKTGEYSEADHSFLVNLSKNAIAATDSMCSSYLGTQQAANLRKEILGQ